MTSPATITPLDLDGILGFTIVGPSPQIGWGIAPLRDVNGDGRNDFIISTAGDEAYIVYGGTTFGATFDLASLTRTSGFVFNARLPGTDVGGFDMNGDGLSDVVIGGSVLFGSRSGLPASSGDLAGWNGFVLAAGRGSAPLGDFNGDGFDDLLVTFSGQDFAAVVYGRGSGWSSTLETRSLDGTDGFYLRSPLPNTNFATAVRSAGDFNGDGLADLIIGAPLSTIGHGYATGAAYVVFGQAGIGASVNVNSLDGSNGFMIVGAEGGGRLGWSMGRAGDVNGDGYDDILVQATDADPHGYREGSTYLLFGGPGGFPAVFDLETIDGLNGVRIDCTAYRGQAADVATGDFNGDGYDDIAIGAPGSTPLGEEYGPENAYVIFGRPDGWERTIGVDELDGSNGFTFAGGIGSNDVGRFVEFADVNADGYDDLLVSATRIDGLAGAVFVVYGHSTGELTPFVSTVPQVDGSGSDDVLRGTAVAETLNGHGGDDTFEYSGGSDQFRGDGGFDTVTYEAAPTGVNVRMRPPTVAGNGDATRDLFLSIERVIGSNFADQISGDLTDDSLFGLGGDDALVGQAGGDVLKGNDGNDVLRGGDDGDKLFGGAGDDSLLGDAGKDEMAGGSGNDIYEVDSSGDLVTEYDDDGTDEVRSNISYTIGDNIERLTLTGTSSIDGAANDLDNVLTGNSGSNELFGFGGDDVLDGGAGDDRMTGGTGDDVYHVDSDRDEIEENADEGIDEVCSAIDYTLGDNIEDLRLVGTSNIRGSGNALDNVLTGNSASNELSGLGANDLISGGAGADTLFGGYGNDVLNGGPGVDRLIGGNGDDIYVVDSTSDKVVENVFEGIDSVFASINFKLGANFENLALTGNGGLSAYGNELANVLTGNSGANALYGVDGDDRLVAGAGNDRLDGGYGIDKMFGGTGDDRYYVENAGDWIAEFAGEGTDIVFASASHMLRAELENLVLTGTADLFGKGNELANTITGNSGANSLYGRDGDDRLFGNGGDDRLDGGTGVDRLCGGAGDDTYIVSDATDYAYENAGEGRDTVLASVSHALRAHIEILTLTGSGAIAGEGNELANVITGNSAANALYGIGGDDRLIGGGGNDRLDGGAGIDKLFGGTGDDVYVVSDSTDYVYENAGGGTDAVLASVSHALRANVENLTLTGAGDIIGKGNELANAITGNSGANSLSGNDGNDALHGGAGGDWLDGGAGQDRLFGGDGNDSFVFRDGDFAGLTNWSCDQVKDFATGDKIRLNYVDANTTLDGDQAFAFIGTGAFSGTAGELRYEQISGNTYVSGDTNGDGVADFMIRFDGLHPLQTGDFVL